jgi:hypothetical protein
MMEAVQTSETPVYFNETAQRYIPESCHLHTRSREKLKSHEKRGRLGTVYKKQSKSVPLLAMQVQREKEV